MAKLNKSLVTSIVTDIKELVSVANEMRPRLVAIDHTSWRFPTRNAADVNAMEAIEQHEGSAGELYILLLEVAYDRIHFLLRLILEFIERWSRATELFEEPEKIKMPKYVSLASLVRRIWSRLERVLESISQSSTRESGVNHCESCSLASTTILEAIDAIEIAFEERELTSTAATERLSARGDVYETTQWAVMSRLAGAVLTDVETLVATTREDHSKREATRRDRERELLAARAESSRKEHELAELRATNAVLGRTVEKVTSELEKCQEDRIGVERRNKELRESLENAQKELLILVDGSSVLQSQVGTLAECKLELENSVSGLREKVAEARDASRATERGLRIALTELQKEYDTAKLQFREREDALEREIEAMRLVFKDSRLKASVDERIAECVVPNDSRSDQSDDVAVLMPGDDPVLDMTRQLISNREKIESLSRQNERLSKTLSRLREYRLTVQTTTTTNDPGQ